MLTFSVEQYMVLVGDYKDGRLSQKQATEELNKKYKSTCKYIKQKITDIMKKSELYLSIPGGIDELINIYDKTNNCPVESEHEKYMAIYSEILKSFISDIKEQPDKFGTLGKLDTNLIYSFLYKERDEIAEICRVKKYIDEYYEKYLAEIAGTKPQTDISDYQNHYFMQILKNEAHQAFEVMKAAIQKGLVEFKSNCFNFKCDKGCVGLFFAEAGYTDYKKISLYVLINDEKCKLITLQNAKKNAPPAEWKQIEKIFFGK